MSRCWTLFHVAFQLGFNFQNGAVTQMIICMILWLVNYWFYNNYCDILQGFKQMYDHLKYQDAHNVIPLQGPKKYVSKMLAWQCVPKTGPCHLKYTAGVLQCPLFFTPLWNGSLEQKLLSLHNLKNVDTAESCFICGKNSHLCEKDMPFGKQPLIWPLNCIRHFNLVNYAY